MAAATNTYSGENSFAARKNLREVFDRYKDGDPAGLSAEAARRAVVELRDGIIDAARTSLTGLFHNAALIAVDESQFEAEVKLLKTINRRLDYSPVLTGWLRERRKSWVQQLHRTMPMKKIAASWTNADLNGRLALLREVQAAQAKSYSVGAIGFAPSAIRAHERDEQRAQAFVETEIRSHLDYRVPAINIRRDVLERKRPDSALSSSHHEQVHVLTHQLAVAEAFGMMPAGHVLKANSQHALGILRDNALIPPAIASAYLASPNERLSFGEQDAFEREFIEATPIGPFVIPKGFF